MCVCQIVPEAARQCFKCIYAHEPYVHAHAAWVLYDASGWSENGKDGIASQFMKLPWHLKQLQIVFMLRVYLICYFKLNLTPIFGYG